jgi:adenosine deaminase
MRSQALLALFLFISTTSAFAAPTLQEKLSAQWERYDQARSLLLEQVQKTDTPASQRAIPRDTWEQTLQLPADYAFTPQDLADLKKIHARRIQLAKEKAKRESIINLDRIRTKKTAKQFCEKIPKGGMLHIHPGGTLDRALAAKLLKDVNAQIEAKELIKHIDGTGGNSMLFPEERAWLSQIPDDARYLSLSAEDQQTFSNYLFLPPGKQPFPRFNTIFSFLGYAFPDWEQYDQVLLDFAQRAVREGVQYVEFTGSASEDLFKILAKIEQQTGLTIRVNQAFNRTRDLDTLDTALQTLLNNPGNIHLVGIDFLDNEGTNPALEKGQILYGTLLHKSMTGETQLRRTMHAGEIGDIRNTRDAMILGAQRLGHGVNLAKDPIALEYAAKIHEPIEINISSNLRLTDVEKTSEHPFLNYLRLGLPVSLSTDDEGIFDIDINHECQIAIEQTDVTYAELKKMAYNSISTSFASEADKQALARELTKKFRHFERSHSF